MPNPLPNDSPGLQNLGQEELHAEKHLIKLIGEGKLGEMHFLIRRNVRLGRLMKIYSDSSDIALERLRFSYHGQVIKPDDTSELLKINTDDCDVVISLKDKKVRAYCRNEIGDKQRKKKKYIVLVVAGDSFETIQFKITTTTLLWKLKRAYGNRSATPLEGIRFTHNGRQIMDDDTVEKLQMQDYDPVIVSKENL